MDWIDILYAPEKHTEPAISLNGRRVYFSRDILGLNEKAKKCARTWIEKILDKFGAVQCELIGGADLAVLGAFAPPGDASYAARKGVHMMEEPEFWSAAGEAKPVTLNPRPQIKTDDNNVRPAPLPSPGPVTDLFEPAVCAYCHWKRPWGSCAIVCVICVQEEGHHRGLVGLERARWMKHQHEAVGDVESAKRFSEAVTILEAIPVPYDTPEKPSPRVSKGFTTLFLLSQEERAAVMSLLQISDGTADTVANEARERLRALRGIPREEVEVP